MTFDRKQVLATLRKHDARYDDRTRIAEFNGHVVAAHPEIEPCTVEGSELRPIKAPDLQCVYQEGRPPQVSTKTLDLYDRIPSCNTRAEAKPK